MLLQFPSLFTIDVQNTVLVLNTVLLIILLIFGELYYAEKPVSKRPSLRLVYPVSVVLAGLLVMAVYKQVAQG